MFERAQSAQVSAAFAEFDRPIPNSFASDHACFSFLDGVGAVRGARFVFGARGYAVVAGGGRIDDGELLVIIDSLKSLARRLAPFVGYAYIMISETLANLSSTFRVTPLYSSGGLSPDDLTHVSHELVFDAFHYQILGAGHMERLRTMPPGATSISPGRTEVVIGQPTDWLFQHLSGVETSTGERPQLRDPDIMSTAREVLRPCLGTAALRRAVELEAGRRHPA